PLAKNSQTPHTQSYCACTTLFQCRRTKLTSILLRSMRRSVAHLRHYGEPSSRSFPRPSSAFPTACRPSGYRAKALPDLPLARTTLVTCPTVDPCFHSLGMHSPNTRLRQEPFNSRSIGRFPRHSSKKLIAISMKQAPIHD